MPLVHSAVYSENCPQCKATNYYLVDPPDNDCSKFDTDGLRCWKCKHEWIIPEIADAIPELTVDSAVIDDGFKQPTVY